MRKRSIENKILFSISAVILIVGTLVAAFVFWIIHNSMLATQKQSLTMVTEEHAKTVGSRFEYARYVAANAASRQEVIALLGAEEKNPLIAEMIIGHNDLLAKDGALSIIDSSGLIVASSKIELQGGTYAQTPIVSVVQSGVGIIDYYNDPLLQQPFFIAIQPIKSSAGELLGAVAIHFSIEFLQHDMEGGSFNEEGSAMLVDREGFIVLADKADRIHKTLGLGASTKLAEFNIAQNAQSDGVRTLGYDAVMPLIETYTGPQTIEFFDANDDEEEFITISRVGTEPFYLLYEYESEEIEAAPLRIAAAIAVAVVLSALVANVIISYVLRRSLDPILVLQERVSQLGSGNFKARFDIKTGDEIEDLGNAFNYMARNLGDLYGKLDKKVKEKTADLEKFQMAVTSAFDHIVITDADGIVLYANKGVERITGFPVKEVIGKKAGSKELWGGLMDRKFYKHFWDEIKNKKHVFIGELTNKKKNGEEYVTLASVSPVLENGKVKYFVGIERDITQQRKYEESLNQYAAIVCDTSDAIIGKDNNGIMTSWNSGAEKLYGYTAEEAIGRNVSLIVPKDLHHEIKEILDRIAKDEKIEKYQTVRKRKDGSLVDVSLTISPVHDSNGAVVGSSIIARDITREMQVDRAKSEFVSLASHQLRTPLTSIKWNAELLLNGETGRMSKESRECIQEIFLSNERMIDLVNSLLNVSRIDLGTVGIDPKQIDPVEISKSVLRELLPVIKEKEIVVVEKYSKNKLTMDGDPRLLRIILQNLLSNATKYTPEKGTISITIEKKDKDIMFTVRDNGMGVPKKQQEKIFTKLFRADNAVQKISEGTGLGLYVTKQVVEQSGGKIWFTSRENWGSTFHFTLPQKGMKRKEGNKELSPSIR